MASQAFSNLVNALMLGTRKLKPIQANTHVQECLVAAKTIRKQVVCYIQYLIPDTTDMGIESQLSHTMLTDENASLLELNELQEKQRDAVARAHHSASSRSATGNTGVHPDLHDLDFNALSSDAAGAIWQEAARHCKLWEKARHTGLYQSFSDEDLTGEEAVRQQALLDNGTPGIADKQGMNWS
ncbi:hypothetical protein K439DRAFT_1543274 [Ramaria rubella]|nr:hypothetical protein K439DRAFT_1543274 [Ramaria rubella]